LLPLPLPARNGPDRHQQVTQDLCGDDDYGQQPSPNSASVPIHSRKHQRAAEQQEGNADSPAIAPKLFKSNRVKNPGLIEDRASPKQRYSSERRHGRAEKQENTHHHDSAGTLSPACGPNFRFTTA